MRHFVNLEKKSGKIPLILKLDSAGVPCCWIKWQDVVIASFTDKIKWHLGNPIIMNGGQGRDGNTSHFELYPIIATDDQSGRKKKRCAPPLTNRVLFLRDQHTCAYCGHEYSGSKLSRDHIIPVSRGGQNTWGNTVTSCKSCNMKKSDRMLSECGMKLRFQPYTPNSNEFLILQNRRILPEQYEYLVKGVSRFFKRIEGEGR